MKGTRVAPRFAKAVLDLANENKVADKVAEDMRLLNNTIKGSKDLQLLIESPIVDSGKKKDVFKAIFEGKLDKLTAQFLDLLIGKTREFALEAITESYLDFYRQEKGIVKAEVLTATPLSAENKASVSEKIKAKFDAKEVEIVEVVNPELIGGVIVRVNGMQLDLSVAGRLSGMRKEILN